MKRALPSFTNRGLQLIIWIAINYLDCDIMCEKIIDGKMYR